MNHKIINAMTKTRRAFKILFKDKLLLLADIAICLGLPYSKRSHDRLSADSLPG
ncbi:MAG: hypothetical protein M1269_07670 [Chloroflexi bacterium]|nr:hypothetical protein [Chloroflexota bacterium]